MNLYNETFKGNIRGSANTSCKLLGWERITVPAGTYVAMKMVFKVAFAKGTRDVKAYGERFRINFSITGDQTLWCVPDIGVVKVKTDMSIKMNAEGENASVRIKETAVLRSNYGTKSVSSVSTDKTEKALPVKDWIIPKLLGLERR